MLWGRHGIGKSASIAQLAKKLGMNLLTVILSQKEAVDIAGVLYTFEDKALGMSVTAAHPPDWFAKALKKGNTILFFDEFNMARREVMNAAFELILDRRLNNLKLPDSVFIVCAGNPDDERYDVTPMSESLRDRLMHLKVVSDVKAWLRWAKSSASTIHPDVVKFIELDPKALYNVDKRDETFPVEIKHGERSWERVGVVQDLDLPLHLKAECLRGIVGPEYAASFVKSFGTKDVPLDAMDILELNPFTVQRIQEFCNPKKMRIDLLARSIENLVKFANENLELTTKRIENVKKFLKMLPDDSSNLAIGQLFELPGWSDEFLNDPELRQKINIIAEAKELKSA